tara:strand:- start:172 stop:1527 length:1356 start_codon:yes stop_codon:yes gene_type:complete
VSVSAKSFSVLNRDIFLYLTQMITSIIVARSLGPELLGIYYLIGMIPTYAETFGRFKFDVAAVYYLGKNKYNVKDVLAILNIVAAISSLLIVLIIICQVDILNQLLFSNTDLNVNNLVYIIICQIPLQFFLSNYAYIMLHNDDIGSYNVSIVLKSLSYSVMAVIFLYLFKWDLLGLVIATVLSSLISLTFSILKVGNYGRPSKFFNIPLIKDLAKYGVKVYLNGIISYFQVYVVNWIVAFYLLPSQVAYFSLAKGYSQLLEKVPNALNLVLFPKLTKIMDREHSIKLVSRAFRIILILLSIIGLVFIILIKPAVYILYGAEYLFVVKPFIIMIPGIVIGCATTPFIQYFLSSNQGGIVVIIPIASLIIQVVLCLLLIPKFGILGGAFAFFVGLILLSITTIIFFKRESKVSFKKDLILKREDFIYLYNLGIRGFAILKKSLSNFKKNNTDN